MRSRGLVKTIGGAITLLEAPGIGAVPAEPGQAAAEYVGTTIGIALRSVVQAAGSAADWVGDHPWLIAIAVLGVWLIWRVLRR